MARLLVNFATRSRPEQFFKCLDNLREMADGEYTVIVKIDHDDPAGLDAYNRIADYPECILKVGTSKNKIHAINRNLVDDWDILLNHSDDMWMIYKGWDTKIREDFTTLYPDFDGVLHYPDGNRRDLMTYSIIGKKYYDRTKYIYNPAYTSLFCDDEAMVVAQRLDRYTYLDFQIFEHRHPAFGKGIRDEQYRLTEAFFQHDKQVYQTREAKNFDL